MDLKVFKLSARNRWNIHLNWRGVDIPSTSAYRSLRLPVDRGWWWTKKVRSYRRSTGPPARARK
eukprot:scaffold108917_cov50-Attheya_sp.AAC.2